MSKQTDLINVTDAITVDSSNNRVGINTSLPAQALHVQDAGTGSVGTIQMGVDYHGYVQQYANNLNIISNGDQAFRAALGTNNGTGNIVFQTASTTTGNTERMRIDAAGNLLVGKTSGSDINTNGFQVDSSGRTGISRDNGSALILNRTSSDGSIQLFRKDNVTVGSIGIVSSDNVFLSGNSSHSGIMIGTTAVFPFANGTAADNSEDLGSNNIRWDDVYATNGTIQTSDRNEKQDIEVLSDAEQRVAVACKGLLRKFRWIDAVAEKGDDARIHFGIIAQDLQDAFTAEGLDAGRYAMFISTTWWETQTDVPAVEAVAEVLDEDGNVVTEAVEAKEAYTRTDTYETLEEAPEGATERTRLGVRYPELLAFIIGVM
ncbi:tail fiber domain-containing protein [Octadecabacter sp.]|nr:tail fiber domain-containing protein [Octadecabacter sp.]